MPIKFRCAYCNQLLGIARRKAGSVVKCPTCSGQVVVPSAEDLGEAPEPPAPTAAPPPPGRRGNLGSSGARPAVPRMTQPALFEGNELDRLLEGAAGEMPSVLNQPHAPAPNAPVAPMAPVVPMAPLAPARGTTNPAPAPPSPGAAPVGFFLTPARATLWSVAIVLALAVAFGSGLLVGMYVEHHRTGLP